MATTTKVYKAEIFDKNTKNNNFLLDLNYQDKYNGVLHMKDDLSR